MKRKTVISRVDQEQHRKTIDTTKAEHEQQIQQLADNAPLPFEVVENDTGEPIKLSNGVTVMPGDYYSSERVLALSAEDIGTNGAWEEVK